MPIINLNNLTQCLCGITWGCPAFKFLAIVEKKQIIRLAFSLSFTVQLLSSRFSGPIFFLTLWLVALDNTFQYAEVVVDTLRELTTSHNYLAIMLITSSLWIINIT